MRTRTFLKTKDELRAHLLKMRRIIPETGCWEWVGGKAGNGYGVLRYRGHQYQVSRLSAYAWNGFDLASKLQSCHRCDNPVCINPEHLFSGTAKDNAQDAVKKGREPIGERNGQSKLTDGDVNLIWLLATNAGLKTGTLAKMFGVYPTVIYKIKTGQIWKRVTALAGKEKDGDKNQEGK